MMVVALSTKPLRPYPSEPESPPARSVRARVLLRHRVPASLASPNLGWGVVEAPELANGGRGAR
ncbi:hypothetical protein TIFTF001_007162 [Ficus carica]|uniref:Uncharacterized protein n=1 Tax=Ficus carica TaxID=3494 RepID=A0AA87ZKL7_FICCA|nr:hypothetical protein TIFTF001_007162 [Ficus carica]